MKVAILKRELSSERERFSKVEGIISSLRTTNEELDALAAYLFVQVLKVEKEATAATKVTTATNKAQGVGIQVGLTVFHKQLLQLNPKFSIQALEILVTLKAMDTTIAEVKDKITIGQEGATAKGVANNEEAA